MITNEDKKMLDRNRMENIDNAEFMNTIFSIAEKHNIFKQEDIDMFLNLDKCRKKFKYFSKPIMINITGLSEDAIDDLACDACKDGRKMSRYYKSPRYTFFDQQYIVTNDMYGKRKSDQVVKKDNRTPIYDWFMHRLQELELITIEDKWYPSLEEYDPCISKEQWIQLLQNENVFTMSALDVIGCFFKNGGQGSCIELKNKYGNSVSYYKSNSINLAERVMTEINCSKPKLGENSKLWPILFFGRNAENDEEGSFIWKLRPELYDALSDFYAENTTENRGEAKLTDKEIIEHIKAYIDAKGFSYNEGLIENFYLSLKSKPFVILAGTSGTGKTRLVRLFSEAIGATSANGRYKLVSVRPDWSDSSDLFGHVDLNGNFVDGAITKFVEKAMEDKSNPYFLCLDEMNLARVEYYLSDILSIMETRDYRDNEIVTDDIILEGHKPLMLPENLYIIGTVNMDETTFPFSKKVLDRANTIEFSYVDLLTDFNKTSEKVDALNQVKNSFLKTEYLYLLNCTDEEKLKATDICGKLQNINEILKTANAHVGYRVRDEIVFYMLNNSRIDLLSEEDALDNEILQKILPRIQGSSSAIRDMICELFRYCAGDYDGYRSDSGEISKKMLKALNGNGVKYVKSAEKLAYMMRRYEEDGFTSYWL